MARSSNRPQACRAARRSLPLRLLALFLALLAFGAQPRVIETVRLAPESVSRVAERPATIDTNAVHAESSVGVASAPVLERSPVVSGCISCSTSPSARLFLAGSVRVQRAERVTHFHAKRRIPRMNSEEPPRS